MAEGLVAAGAAASLIQIADFGFKIGKRIAQYTSASIEIPEEFNHVQTQLPLISYTLEQLRKFATTQSIDEASSELIVRVIDACTKEVEALKDIILAALPDSKDGTFKKTWKAVGSVATYDEKVRKKRKTINSYIKTLQLAMTSSQVTTGPSAAIVTSTIAPRAVGVSDRDLNFIHRPILDDLTTKSAKPMSRVALFGIGGIGKSQLAIEYIHQVRDISEDTWVFWVHAATVARFEESYRDIATAVGLYISPNAELPDVFKKIREWLSNTNNGKWIMVVDNADDIDVWKTPLPVSNKSTRQTSVPTDSTTLQLHSLLPSSRNGKIIVTTRNRKVAKLLIESPSHILQVKEMTELEAVELFQKKMGDTTDATNIDNLVNRLDYIPLAISQAASYIAERAGRITIQAYVDELSNLDEMTLKLLEEPVNDDRSKSVLATWIISFRHIQNTKPSAARLLSLLAFFDRKNISEDLVIGQYGAQKPEKPKKTPWWKKRRHFHRKSKGKVEATVSLPDDDFGEDWLVLKNYSLIRIDTDVKHFEMHRLVQITTKQWLKQQNELSYWAGRFITIMEASFPRDAGVSLGEVKAFEPLFPHAQMALAHRPTDQKLLLLWAMLLSNAATYAAYEFLWKDAEAMFRAAVSVLWDTYRIPSSVGLVSSLAITLTSLKDLPEAEKVYVQALAMKDEMYGGMDERTLETVMRLGEVFLDQGKLPDAEKMFRRYLEGIKKLHNSGVNETSLAYYLMHHVLLRQGKQEEVEMLESEQFPDRTSIEIIPLGM